MNPQLGCFIAAIYFSHVTRRGVYCCRSFFYAGTKKSGTGIARNILLWMNRLPGCFYRTIFIKFSHVPGVVSTAAGFFGSEKQVRITIHPLPEL
jgi:hypothetical protein